MPERARVLARLGHERLLDYQGRAYASLYRERLAAVARADRELGGVHEGFRLTVATARHLALWMAFEDVIRVAGLKTRPARFDRIASEARARPEHLVHATEFLHPRFEELCDLLPARTGADIRGSAAWRRRLSPLLSEGRRVTTTRLPAFLLLWAAARLRRFRPHSRRYAEEQARIERWLESAINAARTDYALGVEVNRLQRLVKGYGDTHERGLAKLRQIMAALPGLAARPDAASMLARLHEAALADEEGAALARALAEIATPQLQNRAA